MWGYDLRHVAKDVVNDVPYAGSVMRGEILGLERRRFWRDEDKLEIVMSVGIGIAIDDAKALREGTAPEALRRLVLERASAAADARDIVVAAPSPILPKSVESPIVATAKRAASAGARS